MKKPFSIADCQLPVTGRGAGDGSPLPNRKSQIANRKSERGVALVITLILLSVTLVMAVAFLALSRRDRSAVGTTTDTAAARLAAESALAQAQAQIVANALAFNGFTNVGLIVSTNYINRLGFNGASSSPTNVNFDYTINDLPVNNNEFIQNVANLQILPRVPVFQTNYIRHIVENSFYLDLNQNGVFDTNNWAEGTNAYGPGDPEWIGVLERPDTQHSANNPFTSRYAFIAVPAGGSLDLNYIHNQVKNEPTSSAYPSVIQVNPAADGYFRNQGVGSWEINLAAFLADLNTNEWDADPAAPGNYYEYNEPYGFGSPNRGIAFDDARALLAYRYNNNYSTLAPANRYFPNISANNIFPNDGIDNYGDGPLQTNFDTNADYLPALADDPGLPWAGSDNTNRYYDLSSDLFNASKVEMTPAGPPGFVEHLQAASQAYTTASPASTDPTNYYNRYTFYRMLNQLGTESLPEQGKINLNYSNAVVTYDVNGIPTGVTVIPNAETNLVPWRPLDFFTAAADRLLGMYTTNWFRSNPSNFFAAYYGIPNFYYSYTNSLNDIIPYSPDGFGLVNSFFGTNTIPAFGITNIPVYINGNFVYSPAVNRILQLAANLYDSSTTNFYPSVFRPIFWVTNQNGFKNVYINGYEQVLGLTGCVLGTKNVASVNLFPANPPLFIPTNVESLAVSTRPLTGQNVYGVPWIIGIKKQMPGLNQFSMVNAAQITRRLQVARQSFGSPVWTNQLIVMNITNSMGVSFWNPYATDYPTNYSGSLNVNIYVSDLVQMVLTNSAWAPGTTYAFSFPFNYVQSVPRWEGSEWAARDGGQPNSNAFYTFTWTNVFLPSEIYNFTNKSFNSFVTGQNQWDTSRQTLDPLPQFGLLTTNWLRTVVVDNTNVIDYVEMRDPIDGTNITTSFSDPNYADTTGAYYLWSTNLYGAGSPTWGVINQVNISSKNQTPPASAIWNNPPNVSVPGIVNPITAQRIFFAAIMQPGSFFQYVTDVGAVSYYTNIELAVQAPYTAERTAFVTYLYQVNDPLVHSLASDLNAGQGAVWGINNKLPNGVWHQDNGLISSPMPPGPPGYQETTVSRYQPWGKAAPNAFQAAGTYNFSNPYNLIYKDPLVWGADYWDFPTNRYPSVGWIGRVHRGTPWQTVYLKAHNVVNVVPSGASIAAGTNTWEAWTGDYNGYDAVNSAPIQDRLLFDLFTSTPDDNASHGQLSVNQSQLASWSALLSGIVVITNTLPSALTTIPATILPEYGWTNIQPAGVSGMDSALGNILTNINNQRAFFTNADGMVGSFEHVGDVLSTVELTEASPFLDWNHTAQQEFAISDEAYEWLPQQTMSLLSCPTAQRYVVYCYGQTLKPAPNSLVTSGSFFGLCTNYQVVAESAVRAVIQLHPVVVRNPNAEGFITNYTTTVESFTTLPAY